MNRREQNLNRSPKHSKDLTRCFSVMRNDLRPSLSKISRSYFFKVNRVIERGNHTHKKTIWSRVTCYGGPLFPNPKKARSWDVASQHAVIVGLLAYQYSAQEPRNVSKMIGGPV